MATRVRGSKAKRWCFTLNNYTPDDVDRLMLSHQDIEYLLFGREVASTGTRHLQGLVCFRSRKRLEQVRTIISQRAHCSITVSLQRSIEYCKKEGDFTEIGTVPIERERSEETRVTSRGGQQKSQEEELEAFKAAVKEGLTDMKEIRQRFSMACAWFPSFVRDFVADHRPKPEVEDHRLRRWQQMLYDILISPPNPREIIFIVDPEGNQGKSWFARYFRQRHKEAQIVLPGKKADMAYIINPECTIFIFDCPRSKQGDFIQYDLLEELKNGLIFSSKYESAMKELTAIPHIVVLMNEHPCMDKLSADRYKIIDLPLRDP